MDLTRVSNIEKSIERWRKNNIGNIPKTLNELQDCLQKENWKQLLVIDQSKCFTYKFVKNNGNTNAIIFIDEILTNELVKQTEGKLTIFVDGTFATVPQLKNKDSQLWTILIRHNNRVSKTINILVQLLNN